MFHQICLCLLFTKVQGPPGQLWPNSLVRTTGWWVFQICVCSKRFLKHLAVTQLEKSERAWCQKRRAACQCYKGKLWTRQLLALTRPDWKSLKQLAAVVHCSHPWHPTQQLSLFHTFQATTLSRQAWANNLCQIPFWARVFQLCWTKSSKFPSIRGLPNYSKTRKMSKETDTRIFRSSDQRNPESQENCSVIASQSVSAQSHFVHNDAQWCMSPESKKPKW